MHQITDKLVGVMLAGGVRSLVRFDQRNQKFIVVIPSNDERSKASALIPADLASDVLVTVGRLPQDSQQTGYVSGDFTYGGWASYATPNDPRCTTGFVVKLSDATYGVTTAGHCSVINPSIYVTNHYVTLNPPRVQQNSAQYDFKVHPTDRLTVYGHVYYINNITIRGTSIVNSVAGYANSGYFPIEDGLYIINHGMGVTMCKSGQRTGLSCGQIVSDYASYVTEDGVQRSGMIALGNSNQRVIGWAGDSGGSVFTPPVNGKIRAAGLVSGANAPSASTPCDTSVYSTCELYYMPIDRINDAQPMQVKTLWGHESLRSLFSLALFLLTSCSGGGMRVVSEVDDGIVAFRKGGVRTDKLVVIDAVEYRGAFSRKSGCLVLTSDGSEYTPLFNNVDHLRTAVRESGQKALHHSWSIAGGPGAGNWQVSPKSFGKCQRPLFVILSISDPQALPSS